VDFWWLFLFYAACDGDVCDLLDKGTRETLTFLETLWR